MEGKAYCLNQGLKKSLVASRVHLSGEKGGRLGVEGYCAVTLQHSWLLPYSSCQILFGPPMRPSGEFSVKSCFTFHT